MPRLHRIPPGSRFCICCTHELLVGLQGFVSEVQIKERHEIVFVVLLQRLAVAASMNVCTTMESVRSCALTPTTVTIARANLVTSLLTMPIRARVSIELIELLARRYRNSFRCLHYTYTNPAVRHFNKSL
jgi:hypothetical protein